VVTFAIATVSWRLVEKPVLDWVHGRRRRAQRLMQPAAEVA